MKVKIFKLYYFSIEIDKKNLLFPIGPEEQLIVISQTERIFHIWTNDAAIISIHVDTFCWKKKWKKYQ